MGVSATNPEQHDPSEDDDYANINFNNRFAMIANPNSCFSVLFVENSFGVIKNKTSIDISLDPRQDEYLIMGEWQDISFEMINLIGD